MNIRRFFTLFPLVLGFFFLTACGTLAIQIEPIPESTPSILPSNTPTPTLSPVPFTQTPTLRPSATSMPNALQLKPGTSLNIKFTKMVSAQNGWAIGEVDSDLFQHILFTKDGGYSWQDRTPAVALVKAPANGLVAAAYFASSENAWAVYADRIPSGSENPTVVWYTTDGGINWGKSQPLDFGDAPVEFRSPSDLGFSDALHGWVMVHIGAGMSHDYIAIFTTADGGKTWQRVVDPNKNPNMMGCGKSGLTFNTISQGWITTDCPGLMPRLVFYQTSDGGESWNEMSLPVPAGKPANYFAQSEIGCGIPELVFSSARSLLLTLRCSNYNNNTSQSWLYATNDMGINWSQHVLPFPFARIDMLNSSEGFLVGANTSDPGAGGAVYHTTDGGEIWKLQTTTTWTGTADFVDSHTGWVIATHNQVTAFVRTLDGGATWAELKPIVGP